MKATGAVPALVDAYQATAGDSTYVARAAILTALNTLDPASRAADARAGAAGQGLGGARPGRHAAARRRA